LSISKVLPYFSGKMNHPETQANNPDVRYVFIVDKYGQVLAHTFGAGFPTALLNANQAEASDHHHLVLLQTESGLVWDTAVPIFEGRAGLVRLGLTDARQRAAIQSLTIQLLVMIGLASALGIFLAVSLTWVLTRPILELVLATRAVAQGDFSPRVPRWADDEIGDLAEAFNAMTAELGHADEIRREREGLRRQLLERVAYFRGNRRAVEPERQDCRNLSRAWYGEIGAEQPRGAGALCAEKRIDFGRIKYAPDGAHFISPGGGQP
jgi:HAMP domain-containing protein